MLIFQTEGKSLVPFFRKTYVVSVGFKMKCLKTWNYNIIVPCLKRAFSSVKTKANQNFAVKPAERSSHSFLLSI